MKVIWGVRKNFHASTHCSCSMHVRLAYSAHNGEFLTTDWQILSPRRPHIVTCAFEHQMAITSSYNAFYRYEKRKSYNLISDSVKYNKFRRKLKLYYVKVTLLSVHFVYLTVIRFIDKQYFL